ncbi:RNA 2',3'-cyclic phosphodiesterase [Desulfovibrio mangrovi]|uniref:RNA 2',3'-cyclic phosphodiesterase n=1 Tax=Desulfovibrio mangrovi TaxID=2976983 RepID=UPI002246D313|nr:RNA 2',3'-cyclic phosphodiesterase [Desulfovibrio mangrovi]UZP66691.1 RNA 2',3'-cyclic phosphodiesterase [Desulfovibrio mangrovi]
MSQSMPRTTLRLFVAIELPEVVKTSLKTLQEEPPRARWATPDNLHLTLRFIGEVTLDQAEGIRRQLRSVRFKPFPLRMHKVGYFFRKPQAVLWAGMEASDPLQNLKNDIDDALRQAALTVTTEYFVPHITLGRMKHAEKAELKAFAARHATWTAPAFTVTGFILFSSVLNAKGATHNAVERYGENRSPNPDDAVLNE